MELMGMYIWEIILLTLFTVLWLQLRKHFRQKTYWKAICGLFIVGGLFNLFSIASMITYFYA